MVFEASLQRDSAYSLRDHHVSSPLEHSQLVHKRVSLERIKRSLNGVSRTLYTCTYVQSVLDYTSSCCIELQNVARLRELQVGRGSRMLGLAPP